VPDSPQENYKRPPIVTPGEFRGAGTASGETSVADRQWAEVFHDEQLKALLGAALEQNYDVRPPTAPANSPRSPLAMAAVGRLEGAIFIPQHGHSRSDGTEWIEACIAITKDAMLSRWSPFVGQGPVRAPGPSTFCALRWSARRLKLAV
jgi:hypothetical protein